MKTRALTLAILGAIPGLSISLFPSVTLMALSAHG